MNSTIYTTEEVAQMLRVSLTVIRNAVRTGELKGIKVGREYRFTQDALDAYIAAKTSS